MLFFTKHELINLIFGSDSANLKMYGYRENTETIFFNPEIFD